MGEKVFKGLYPIDLSELTNARNTYKDRYKGYLPQYLNAKLYCATCSNIATQMATFQMEGATRLERFCDNCIKEDKHLKQSDFESLIIKAEYGNPDYDILHAPKAKNIGPDYYRIHRRHRNYVFIK